MSASRHPLFGAGDFWLFAEPGAEGLESIDIHQLFSQACGEARTILNAAGFKPEEITHDLKSVRARVEQGSLEDVAVSVLVAALRCMPLLDRAKPSAKPLLQHAEAAEDLPALIERTDRNWAMMVDDLATLVASFAMKYTILISMSRGLTAAAVRGRKEYADRAAGAAAVNARKTRDRDQRKRRTVEYAQRELAFPLPAGKSRWTTRVLAEQVHAVWPDNEARPSLNTIVKYVTEALKEGALTLPA